MNPFKKKPKLKAAPGPTTLQEYQNEFNQVLFQMGQLVYRKFLINKELTSLNDQISGLYEKADKLGIGAGRVRAAIEQEIVDKTKEASETDGKGPNVPKAS